MKVDTVQQAATIQDPRANAELVFKFNVALKATLSAFPMLISKFRPNVALSILSQNFP
jgi:hypothetical protein